MRSYKRIGGRVKKWYRGQISSSRKGERGNLRVYYSWSSMRAGMYYWRKKGYTCGRYWKERTGYNRHCYKFYCYK